MAEPLVRGYRDLKVWRMAIKLARECYRLAVQLPPSEEHGLKSQIRRAASSVCNNIVEGNASATRVGYARYVGISRASVNEVRSELDLCVVLGYLSMTDVTLALSLADQVSAILWVMREKLARLPDENQRGMAEVSPS